jgi:SUMO ligase MMS21 Smc5/6 complex component
LKLEPTPIPAFVATLLVEDAISKKQDCSIMMEPVTKESAVVTNCYHVFNKDAIARWLETNTSCPVCKQLCRLSS